MRLPFILNPARHSQKHELRFQKLFLRGAVRRRLPSGKFCFLTQSIRKFIEHRSPGFPGLTMILANPGNHGNLCSIGQL